MVIMALFTTFMTTPVLELICPKRILGDEAAATPQVVLDRSQRSARSGLNGAVVELDS
jgi:hypothetical protein